SPPNSPGGRRAWEGFFQGMQELGYVEGQNILQRATSTIPIVMGTHVDPVRSGLVASLAKPEKNVTGMSTLGPELVGKLLQLLKEVVPGISRVAVLSNPTDTAQALLLKEAQVAAQAMKVHLQILEARAPRDFADAFSAMTKERAGGVIVFTSSMFYAERARIAELAARSRVPAMYTVKDYAEAGGLLAYGVDLHESFRRAATYVDKILKGAKPADLPVQQATTFELVINLKTAKALGLTIPPPVLARADEVIQ